MSTQLKLRRGTTAQHSTFTGASGEITVDTTKKTVVVHDGSTAGGVPLAKESDVAGFLTSATAASTYAPLASPTFSGSITASSGTANGVAYLNGSKVLTTGSALTFDGYGLGIGIASSAPYHLNVQSTYGSVLSSADWTPSSGYSSIKLTGNQTGNFRELLFGVDNTAGYTWQKSFQQGVGATAHAWFSYDTEVMRLTSTGLGIGTSSPGAKLQVTSANVAGDDNIGNVYISTTDAQAANVGGKLTFGGLYNATNNYAFAGIAGRKENSTNNNVAGYLEFLTTTSAGALTERMRLDSSGNLGLGVTPSAWGGGSAIDIGSWSSFSTAVSASGTNIATNAYQDSSATWRYKLGYGVSPALYTVGSGGHYWFTAPSGTAGNAISFTQAMTLDASGNLLVGPTSWGYSGNNGLQIRGQSTNNGALFVENSGATLKGFFSADNTASQINVGSLTAHPTVFYTSATERMRIDSSGNVGIGTSSPTSKLVVSGGSLASSGLAFNVSSLLTTGKAGTYDAGTLSAIHSYSDNASMEMSAGTSANYVSAISCTGTAATNYSGTIRFTTYSAERMRIDASGNVVLKTGSLQEVKTALGANDINLSTGNYFTKTISGATTFTVSNVPASGTVGAFILELTNGGSATVTWFSGVKWASGTAPTLTASGVDIIAFYSHDGGTTWRGAVVSKDSK